MDIGTAEIIEDMQSPKRRHAGVSGGSSSGGNGGGRDPGGGSDRPDGNDAQRSDVFIPDKSRIVTGVLLLIVTMTFGGLIAAYIVLATNKVAEWRPFELPLPVWISTAIILMSSIAFHLGKTAVDRNDQPAAKRWFIATTALGAAFISSQMLAWLELTARGLYMHGNPYAGFFYILTAIHAVHVLGGITALGVILLKLWRPTERTTEIARRQTLASVIGWYWHFMGVLWVILFVLLGFWK
ncbi:MAG: heme-copper oxidase subunit III [Acidobacteriota bacterium]